MRVVLKYPVGFDAPTIVEVPQNAELMLVALQRNVPTLWYLVDPSEWKEPKTIVVVGTGHPLHARADALVHLGSVITPAGDFVWHIFEVRQ